MTILAKGHKVVSAKSYYAPLTRLLKYFKIPINDNLKDVDVIINVHGRDKIKKFPYFGGYNIHPYLSKYKGSHPIQRAIKNNDFDASVGIHKMTDRIDEGQILIEKRMKVKKGFVEEIYNQLYPCYIEAIVELLDYLSVEMAHTCIYAD